MNRSVWKKCAVAAVGATALALGGDALRAQLTLPSTQQSPYVRPSLGVVSTGSILSVGDQVGAYRMVGLPDGLGAFDNGNDTFTLLMNHEIVSGGATRAHGSNGAFVSEWVIDKND